MEKEEIIKALEKEKARSAWKKAVISNHGATWKCACGSHHFSMVKE